MDPDERRLSGRRIVITRSAADNRLLAAELAAHGAEVIEIPLVEVLPPTDGGRALAEAAARLHEYEWVVLTSVNGVEALHRATGTAEWPETVTVAPVGPATEAAARAAGMLVGPPPKTATAKDLAASFADQSESAPNGGTTAAPRVLAPLAELASDTIVDGLTAKGYRIDRVTAYRTVAPPSPLSPSVAAITPDRAQDIAPGIDAVLFFSPSVVDRFIDRFGDGFRDGLPPAVCIGPSTADRAAERGFVDVMIAEPHTTAGITDALGAIFAV